MSHVAGINKLIEQWGIANGIPRERLPVYYIEEAMPKATNTEQLASDIIDGLQPIIEKMSHDAVNRAVEEVLSGPKPTGLLGDALLVAVDHWREAPIRVRACALRGDLPKRATAGSSGYDLTYNPPMGLAKVNILPTPKAQEPGLSINAFGTVTFYNGNTALLPTGLALKIPAGFEAQIRPRSGFSCLGFSIGNSPGTIDSDYAIHRNQKPVTDSPLDVYSPSEIKVLLRYDGQHSYDVKPGDRIAQIVFAASVGAEFEVMAPREFIEACVAELSPEEAPTRNGGFGSTGQ